MSAIKELCTPIVVLVLPTSDGGEATVTIGDDEEEATTFSWTELQELTTQDLGAADYVKSESASLGVLGDRMILEVGRFNSKDEMYMNVVSLLTLSSTGKVVKMESFADSLAPSLLDAALLKEQE